MPLLINGQKVNDSWVDYDADAADSQSGQIIYPLEHYLAHQDSLKESTQSVGIKVTGDDDLNEILASLAFVALVAIDFPVLRDGRGFSIARQIERKGFKGEIRAVGDVSYDRLDNMHRSGFNAYLVPDERYSEDMIKAFTEISVNYQPTHNR